ncbi:MAG: UTP--glucose-1-phosphate uridylyltransferase [Opitutales bacterium]|nr:UTP--glucose-1-phosphate uridylyltransferase [Opitutales bacterium]
MKIRTAVLTSAKRGHTHLPLQTMIDREGFPQATLALQLKELVDAGIERVGIVVAPGQAELYGEAVAAATDCVTFIEQTEPRGFGDAVLRAKGFVGDAPFVLSVGDHLFVSDDPAHPCVAQLIAVAERERAPVASVQSTHESEIGLYGTIGGVLEDRDRALFRIRKIVEKPTPTQAELELLVPGLRSGHYLCFFGMHVLTPRIFELLEADAGAEGGLALTPALHRLAETETFYAFEIAGHRYNLEERHGLLMAQLALALASPHRDEVLTRIVRLLAHTQSPAR